MIPIKKPNHPNLTAPIPKFSILSADSPPAAMQYKNAPTITIPNAGASKNIPKKKVCLSSVVSNILKNKQ